MNDSKSKTVILRSARRANRFMTRDDFACLAFVRLVSRPLRCGDLGVIIVHVETMT